MMLANTYRNQPISGWWISEKLDGVRIIWDKHTLRTRSWRAVQAPEWFTAAFPRDVALDGELWLGRGTFQIASELSRFARASDAAWHRATFRLFDVPTTDAIKFEDRQAQLATFANEIVRPVAVRKCSGVADALAELAEVVRGGGEGVMLKRPTSCYSFDRSSDWLKLKPKGAQ